MSMYFMFQPMGKKEYLDTVLLSEKGLDEVRRALEGIRKLQQQGRISKPQLKWWEEFVREEQKPTRALLPLLQFKSYMQKPMLPETVDRVLEQEVMTKINRDNKPSKVRENLNIQTYLVIIQFHGLLENMLSSEKKNIICT